MLAALSGWGIQYMTEPEGGEEFRSHWLSLAASFSLHDRDPAAPPASIELRASASPTVIEISGGQVRSRLGPAAAPDLVLSGSPGSSSACSWPTSPPARHKTSALT